MAISKVNKEPAFVKLYTRVNLRRESWLISKQDTQEKTSPKTRDIEKGGRKLRLPSEVTFLEIAISA